MRVTLFAFFLLLVGCASTVNKTMDSWLGHHQSELIQSWGPPQQVSDDGQGGRVLVYGNYVSTGQLPGTAYGNGFGGVNYTAPQQMGYQRTRMFFVNPDGYIYSWRWQGM